MENIYIMYSIALLSIIFGFLALLTQKKYFDRETNQLTEIEIPFLGKMKTNFPALVFVFIGFVLAFITFNKSYEKSFDKKPIDWKITGSFKIAGSSENTGDIKNYLRTGKISIFPCSIETFISDLGTFEITAELAEGVTFESAIQRIDFAFPDGIASIKPNEEYQKYINREETLIKSVTQNTREFKPITITHLQIGSIL